jgi:adenylate cyclase
MGTADLASIRAAMARGEYLLAFDEATAAVEKRPDDVELRYLAVLALARAGATDRAAAVLASSDLEAAAGGASPALQEDVAALGARLAKDRALAATGQRRRARAREAAERYEATYRRLGRSYTCINAATMWLAAGDPARSAELARAAGDLARREDGDPYWAAATEAEAALLLQDPTGAADALTRAAATTTDLAALASTRRQLQLVCELHGLDEAVLAPLAAPTVVHYCGHMVSRRFPPEAEAEVAGRIGAHLDENRVGFGFGSLACGADVLFAEALLARGAELHVHLPFGVDEFRRVSVARGGEGWLDRFDRCLGAATSVTHSTTGGYLGHDSLFDYCSRLAMGHALIRATFLAAPVEQVVVWDGSPASGEAGTAVDVATWRRHGRRTTVIPAGTGTPGEGAGTAPASPRSVHAMLFADVKGFSRLPDAQMGVFLDAVMTPLARTLQRFDGDILFRNSWGDGLYVVLRDVTAAASCALALQDTMRELDPAAVGLPPSLGLRIGAHVGPVFEAVDPIRGERNYYGVEVTRTARIEPRTPEGDVYVTDPFAALIALEEPEDLSCQYVGHIPTAKDYGTFPMYVLKRRG